MASESNIKENVKDELYIAARRFKARAPQHFPECRGDNEICREQLPNINPHVCWHTYCSSQAKAVMKPKALQYLMGYSDTALQ